MSTKKIDPLIKDIETAIDLGNFVSYYESDDFIKCLEGVKAKIDALVESDAKRVINLYEVFIAAAYEKADEIDDSDGALGQLGEELFCSLIQARQKANLSSDDTAAAILRWIETDNYGFCYDLIKPAAETLNAEGRKSLRKMIESNIIPELEELSNKRKDTKAPGEKISCKLQNQINNLKIIMVAQNDVNSYIELCGKSEFTPADCETVAKLFVLKKNYIDALSWVNQGIKLESKGTLVKGSAWGLPDLKRELLKKLGRANESVQSAWDDFSKDPSVFSYDELMKYVPNQEKKDWHKRATDYMEKKGELSDKLKFFLKTKELDFLTKTIEAATDSSLEDLSHYTPEEVAGKIKQSHPLPAAKLYRAMGFRILNSKKSRYYNFALEHFSNVKEIYEKNNLCNEWEKVCRRIAEQHSRKSSFIGEFKNLASGKGLRRKPEFMERIQSRLNKLE